MGDWNAVIPFYLYVLEACVEGGFMASVPTPFCWNISTGLPLVRSARVLRACLLEVFINP